MGCPDVHAHPHPRALFGVWRLAPGPGYLRLKFELKKRLISVSIKHSDRIPCGARVGYKTAGGWLFRSLPLPLFLFVCFCASLRYLATGASGASSGSNITNEATCCEYVSLLLALNCRPGRAVSPPAPLLHAALSALGWVLTLGRLQFVFYLYSLLRLSIVGC
jgi:hypothetical protein